MADPVIVRDGNRGRLALVHQTSEQDNPKGEVAAESNHQLSPKIITWEVVNMVDNDSDDVPE